MGRNRGEFYFRGRGAGKNIRGKFVSLLLIFSMAITSAGVLSGCAHSSKSEGKIITLNVYQSGDYIGIQEGWMADILKKKFNIKLNISVDYDELENDVKEGALSDIIIWAQWESELYQTAVKNQLLYDWNQDDLLEKYGRYIKENLPDALRRNRELTATITDGGRDALYGFAGNMPTSSQDHQSFFYTWDVRWDLYKKLGYPEVKNLKDFEKLVRDMAKICPTDDSGNKTYAASLWPDWDENMVMCVKSTASAYYGYDELGIGLYDPETGEYHDALEKDGPYLEMLKFYNKLYQAGLLDPDSMTQSYQEMEKKAQKGSILFSIFNYCGSLEYNKPEHTEAGKLMYSLKPEEASPIVYGTNSQGDDRIYSIGGATKYPEKCMEIVNWLSTPEGQLTVRYGPKGVCWKYNSEKKTEFTELGRECHENSTTELGNGYKGTFMNGVFQMLFTPWNLDASNPETDGETYNSENWESNLPQPGSEIEKDWRKKTGSMGVNDYMEKGKHTVSPGTAFTESEKPGALKKAWKKVTGELVRASWKAIYAKTDAQYDKMVDEMMKKCDKYGYEECAAWSADQAAKRKSLEDAITR